MAHDHMLTMCLAGLGPRLKQTKDTSTVFTRATNISIGTCTLIGLTFILGQQQAQLFPNGPWLSQPESTVPGLIDQEKKYPMLQVTKCVLASQILHVPQ